MSLRSLIIATGFLFCSLLGLFLFPRQEAFAFDIAKGEKVFLRCKACHTADKGGAHRIGPNLWGIIGRVAGTQQGFKYSKAMIDFAKTWDVATLDAYLAKPSQVVPQSRMTFLGLKDEQQRADLIAYLNGQSDKPISLKPIKRKTQKQAPSSNAPRETASLLARGAGMEETEAYCSPCHSLKIVVQQGLSEADWDELLDWMVEEQAMEPIEASARKKIIGYLAKHYNPARPHFQQNQ